MYFILGFALGCSVGSCLALYAIRSTGKLNPSVEDIIKEFQSVEGAIYMPPTTEEETILEQATLKRKKLHETSE